MKISICLPVMGRGKMLAQAVYSILAQGYADVELVVQDGGPDNAVRDDPEAGPALAVMGGRLRYEVGADKGIFHAVNKALCRATGDVLYFMCSDDLLCPGALEAVNEVFKHERFGGPVWLYGQTVSAHVSGRAQGIDGQLTTLDEMLMRNRLGQPAVFWNRQLLELAGIFDTRYRWAADYDLWLRFWRRCKPVFLTQTLGVHRHHSGQATQLHRADVELEAAIIAWRHRALGCELSRARGALLARRAYGEDGFPESVN